MGSPRRFLVLALAVSLGGFLVGGGARTSFALLVDQEATVATFSTAACFTGDSVAPSVSSTVISKTVLYVPGFIRQAGTYFVYANVTDGGCVPSGISTVTADVSTVTTGQTAVALVAGSFSVGGVSYNYRSASLTANTTLAAGAKAYTITSTDVATNSQTQSGYSVTVDNTRPTGTNVQTANGGATVGKPELGDSVTLTHSEMIDPQSVLAGWTGASTNVVVRITNGGSGDLLTIRNATNAAQLPLGSVNLIGLNYVTTTRDFGATGTPSTMVQSGNTITVTLTHSELIDPQSVLAGWTGASTNVVVRIAHNTGGDRVTIRNAANTVQLPLGSVNLIGLDYVTVTRDFGATGTPSTMVQSGSTITMTLGTPSGLTGTQAATGTMTLTPSATATDRAGNTCLTTVANETGAADVEF